ncbi:hypothetical protein MBLNU457_6103t1 [Dothideomycetes sp. NU457]
MARSAASEDDNSHTGLIAHLFQIWKDVALTPIRVLTSKFAIKAYITSILYVITAFALFLLAVAAYITFYWTYIPQIGFERTLHLQFDSVPPECLALDSPTFSAGVIQRCTEYPHPWATVNLAPELISQQRYDITIELSMPRTPTNTQTGNFMLDATLYAPSEKASNPLSSLKAGLSLTDNSDGILARARRPAIMTYHSREIELMHKTTNLPWYFLGLRNEAETLSIALFEGVEFDKGWRNVPASMRVEVQTQQPRSLQIYAARAVFKARFRGLRWVMYNHRLLSAGAFIACFWATEMVFASVAWVVLSWIIFGGGDDDDESNGARKIKNEYDDGVKEEEQEQKMSDTERSFPSYAHQPPLRYTSPIKKEESLSPDRDLLESIPLAADADVEDEDADFVLDDAERWRDSGLGTSMESTGPSASASIRRRRSKHDGRGL